MPIHSYPPPSVIKSIQYGVAAAAGSIVINQVTVGKAYVESKSKGSAGTVAASATIPGYNIKGFTTTNTSYHVGAYLFVDTERVYSGAIGVDNNTLVGGTTDLTVKEYSAKLVDSTHISCDGPCEWQVIEYV